MPYSPAFHRRPCSMSQPLAVVVLTALVILITMVVLIALLVTTAEAATYVVRPDGSGDHPDINTAVLAAAAGDVIELTDGTFTGEGNRDIRFPAIALVVRSQSGNPEACVINCQGSEADPHRGFLFERGHGPESVLEGVTITGGVMPVPSAGGAIAVRSNSNPTLSNCRFIANSASDGGGVWCQNSSPAIIDCVFLDNSATWGTGGLYCTGSSPTVERCTFANNTGVQQGGAIGCNFESAPVFTDCVFYGNLSAVASVLYSEDATTPAFIRCTLSHNQGGPRSSVIDCHDSSSVTLISSIITFDSGAQSVACHDDATAVLECCDVFGNAGGDWVECILAQAGTSGNASVDPQFCSSTPDADAHWALQGDSPCAPGNHPGEEDCGQVGAGAVACGVSAIESTTWGAIKRSFM